MSRDANWLDALHAHTTWTKPLQLSVKKNPLRGLAAVYAPYYYYEAFPDTNIRWRQLWALIRQLSSMVGSETDSFLIDVTFGLYSAASAMYTRWRHFTNCHEIQCACGTSKRSLGCRINILKVKNKNKQLKKNSWIKSYVSFEASPACSSIKIDTGSTTHHV